MNNREISRQIQRLQALITKIDLASAGDLELQAHWARYLCVLISGLLENAVGELYGEYVRRQASPSVAAFANASLAAVQTPKTQRFLEIAGRFNSDWREGLTAFVDTDGRRDALDSIIANRHLIAHGKDSGITITRVKDYLTKAIDVLEFIETQCGV
jgi:hypothetical protein